MAGQILVQRVLTIRRVREITAIMDQLFVAPFFKVHRHTCNHVFEAGGRIAEKETLLSFKSELLTVYGCRSNHFFLLSGVSLTATVGSSQRRSRAVSTRLSLVLLPMLSNGHLCRSMVFQLSEQRRFYKRIA